jgi:hypothetical protein
MAFRHFLNCRAHARDPTHPPITAPDRHPTPKIFWVVTEESHHSYVELGEMRPIFVRPAVFVHPTITIKRASVKKMKMKIFSQHHQLCCQVADQDYKNHCTRSLEGEVETCTSIKDSEYQYC